jgi:hypothetical protein
MIKWLHTKVSQMKIIKAYGIQLIKCMQVPQLVFFLLQIVRHFQKKYRVILYYQMDLFLCIKFVFFNAMTPDLSKKNESLFSSPLWYVLLKKIDMSLSLSLHFQIRILEEFMTISDTICFLADNQTWQKTKRYWSTYSDNSCQTKQMAAEFSTNFILRSRWY